MTNTTEIQDLRFQGSLVRIHRATGEAEEIGPILHRPQPFEEILNQHYEVVTRDLVPQYGDTAADEANIAAINDLNTWDRRAPLQLTVYTNDTIEMFSWWPVPAPSDRLTRFAKRFPRIVDYVRGHRGH